MEQFIPRLISFELGFEDRSEADMSAFADTLCDMHALLKKLTDLNAFDKEAEKSAKRYFDSQDRAWHQSSTPDLPKVEFHLIDTGHFALEDKADEIVPLIRDFFARKVAS
jgi:hypothetical protein